MPSGTVGGRIAGIKIFSSHSWFETSSALLDSPIIIGNIGPLGVVSCEL